MILVTGAKGQLGMELCHLLDEQGIEYVGTAMADLDITNAEQVSHFV